MAHPLNKDERRKKGKNRYIRRAKAMELPMEGKLNYHFYEQGKPCSCTMCSPGRFEEKAKYKKNPWRMTA